eukprot:8626047-Alexandrium_andersonii.AAC.1
MSRMHNARPQRQGTAQALAQDNFAECISMHAAAVISDTRPSVPELCVLVSARVQLIGARTAVAISRGRL